MRNLLIANFVRLWRNRLFWLIEAGIFVWGCTVYFLMKINVRNGYLFEYGNTYFFNQMTFVGITLACLCSFFIGTEYSDGTMRNKLAVGHSRKTVYLANLITVVCAGFAQFAIYLLAALTVGVALMGDVVWSSLYRPAESFALAFLSICASAAIAVFLAMVIIDKSKAIFVNVILSVLLLAAGASAVKGLMQPETTQRIYVLETGEYKLASEENLYTEELLKAEEVPNPRYLRGLERQVYVCISAVLPTSQALVCSIEEEFFDRFSVLNVLGTLLFVGAVSGGGMILFMRRDIK